MIIPSAYDTFKLRWRMGKERRWRPQDDNSAYQKGEEHSSMEYWLLLVVPHILIITPKHFLDRSCPEVSCRDRQSVTAVIA